ncbi:hypothetical protein OROHE_015068 [Orobanche hederae]
MVVPIVIRRVTSRGTVFSVLGIVKGLVADRICKGVARAWRIAQEKGHLINVIKVIVFIQDTVEALYQVGKEMDWLNLIASEEMSSVKVELTKIAEVFRTLPQDLKEAFANFQQLEEQSLLEVQLKLHIVESKTVVVLEYMDSRISDHDVIIHDMSIFINSLDEKLSKFEEQQDNVLKVL